MEELIISWLRFFSIESGSFFRKINFLLPLFNLTLFVLVGFLAKIVFNKVVHTIDRLIQSSSTILDNALWSPKFLKWLPRLGYSVILFIALNRFQTAIPFSEVLEVIAYSWLVICILTNISILLDGLVIAYQKLKVPDNFNFKGIIQTIKIVLYLFTIILIISKFIGIGPWQILSGLGALTAVSLLIFKEPISGLAAGIQLFANNQLRVGDWIEMNDFQANGNIIDISLTTVQVQNWDTTIVNIPTHAMITHSFKNWRGMLEKGGRRIKRFILVDAGSIRFITKDEFSSYKDVPALRKYIELKEEEDRNIKDENPIHNLKQKRQDNSPLLTNLGVFREYIYHYLQHHDGINNNLTMLVHQLNSTSKGIPLQIYTFTKSIDWMIYENTQSEIFEHLIAIANEFDLNIFQEPSGTDFVQLFSRSGNG